MKLSPSSEDYLKTILILQKKQGLVRSIDLAQYLGYTKASISRAVNNLRKGGLLTVDSNHFLHLTPTGQRAAEEVYEKYHILTSLLVGLRSPHLKRRLTPAGWSTVSARRVTRG